VSYDVWLTLPVEWYHCLRVGLFDLVCRKENTLAKEVR
jgi:hypothetical protein